MLPDQRARAADERKTLESGGTYVVDERYSDKRQSNECRRQSPINFTRERSAAAREVCPKRFNNINECP
jgi:hypothetical protein